MNDWGLDLSRKAQKFIDKNHILESDILKLVILGARKLAGKNVNIDIIKLKPPYENYYRIRSGRMRITLAFNFTTQIADILLIEWRNSNSYK